ncbi:hypothetical protein ACLM5H_11970 [Fredinandcohnia humi]
MDFDWVTFILLPYRGTGRGFLRVQGASFTIIKPVIERIKPISE